MAVNKIVNKSTKSHGAMRNVIAYVLQGQKVREGYATITGPYNFDSLSWDNVYNSFLEEKRLWNKDSGRMYAHNIISFHKDEQVTPAQCLDIGQQFVDHFFPNHQNLICIHQDKDHLHIHIITNSVSYIDGMKLHQTKKDLEKQKEFTNKLCLEKGLSITEKGKHFDGTSIEEGQVTAWSKDKYNLFLHDDKKSFVTDCAIAVIESKDSCCSKDEFIKAMEERGWSVAWSDSKKHITFQNENGDKVRDSNLSKTFSMNICKEALLNEFKRQNEILTTRDNSIREKERAKQLERYYSEINAVAKGTGTSGKAVRSTETIDSREESAIERRSPRGQADDTKALIREVRATIGTANDKEQNSGTSRKNREIERERHRIEAERAAKEEELRIAREGLEHKERGSDYGLGC